MNFVQMSRSDSAALFAFFCHFAALDKLALDNLYGHRHGNGVREQP